MGKKRYRMLSDVLGGVFSLRMPLLLSSEAKGMGESETILSYSLKGNIQYSIADGGKCRIIDNKYDIIL